jgi:membrane protein DedA with SNARE-associated domain
MRTVGNNYVVNAMPIFTSFLLGNKYLVVFIGAFIEGPIVTTAGGFLYKLGYFKLIPLYFALVFGDLLADIVWYQLGRHLAKPFIFRYGKFFSITKETIAKLENVFQRHQNKILFISKITMGFGFSLATLMAAGMLKISLKRFIWYNFLGELIWTAFLMALGYIFGNIYSVVSESLQISFLIFIFVLVSVALFGFAKFMRSEIIRKKI